MAGATHELWARIALAAVAMHEEAGISVEELLAGLPFDEEGLKRRKRIAWDDYATITERLCEAVGGFREYEDLLAGSHHIVVPEMRAAAGALVTPTMFMRFIIDVIDPIMMPPVEFVFEDLGAHRARITSKLRPGARPCEAFFRGSTGAVRGMTAHLDLPMNEIVTADIAPTHGIWEIEMPQARTLLSRVYRRAQRLLFRFELGREPDGTPVSITLGAPDLDPTAARIDKAIGAWKLSPRQAAVLGRVIAGRSNKEIAHELGCADNTIELHVTRLLRKTNTTSRSQLVAAFWSESWGFPP